MLNNQEILNLVGKAQGGDERSKELLVIENTPLIKSVIKRFMNKGVEYDDLFQLGCVGFLKAIKNFNPNFEVKFSTYVVPMVIGEIKRFMRDDGAIKVSRSLKSLNIAINKFVNEYSQQNHIKPTIKEIADNFKIEEQEVVLAMDSSKMPISLYLPAEDGGDLLVLDKVDGERNDNSLMDNLAIKNAVSSLCQRDRTIILMRYFFDKTQSEISKKLGISQVQVSRLENKILQSIRENFKEG